MPQVIVLVVGFRNCDDIAGCLAALAKLDSDPGFDVYICENGGKAAFEALNARLDAEVCSPAPQEAPLAPPNGAGLCAHVLRQRPQAKVFVGDAGDNLGYAGGVNFWLAPLMRAPGWEAVWVLNPDTEPSPSALAALRAASAARGKGMVGGCLVHPQSGKVANRGLKWRPWVARALALGRLAAVDEPVDATRLEAELSAPSGASVYVTRGLIQRIGLMEDSYFLYFEDLEWGLRAKALGELGYAPDSIVYHSQGTTIGSASSRKGRSPLAVYLGARNTLLFVRRNYPGWAAWTVLMQLVYIATYLPAGAFRNFVFGLKGLLAGVAGRAGPPQRGALPSQQ